MTDTQRIKPAFRNGFRGYNKSEVDDYVARTESVVELLNAQQDKSEQKIRDLEKEIQNQKDENEKLQQEITRLQEVIAEADHDAERIKEAILNAQRMGTIVVEEANQKADDILKQAEEEKLQKEEAARQAIADADEDVRRLVAEAEKKCENLQNDYDRILLDVSGFKADMISMYRRHLELLYALPDAKPYAEKKTEYIDVSSNVKMINEK